MINNDFLRTVVNETINSEAKQKAQAVTCIKNAIIHRAKDGYTDVNVLLILRTHCPRIAEINSKRKEVFELVKEETGISYYTYCSNPEKVVFDWSKAVQEELARDEITIEKANLDD